MKEGFRSSHRTTTKPAMIKYNYLGDVSNRNQMVLKEIFSVEDKFTRKWQDRKSNSQIFYDFNGTQSNGRPSQSNLREDPRYNSMSSRVGRNIFESTIRDNLNLLPQSPHRRRFVTTNPMISPSKITKTNIRNRTYDPINGQEKEFNTPKIHLRALGTHGIGL